MAGLHPAKSTVTLSAVAILTWLSPIVTAHGDITIDHGGHVDNLGDGRNESAPVHEIDGLPTYFALRDGQTLIYAHIVLMTTAWVFLLPVAVMLSIAHSRLALVVQVMFTVVNAIGVVLATFYNAQTPDLYPNNSHHKIGWIVTLIMLVQILLHLIGRLAGAARGWRYRKADAPLPHRITDFWHCTPERYHDNSTESAASDNGQGTETGSDSLRSFSPSTLNDEESPLHDNQMTGLMNRQQCENAAFIRRPTPAVVAKAICIVSSWVWVYLDLIYNAVDRIILPLGFVALTTGIVTLGRFFEGQAIFSGLAHWIKGGVFFWFGILTLGRWSGSFADLGWAWNLTPGTQTQKRWRPSAEFVESGLIFFYGSTNIFLEHLGSWGGEWSSQDLEHLAITVLFIGGGLCGMLIESSTIRSLLNTSVSTIHQDVQGGEEAAEKWEAPDTYSISLNPVPALVILLLGIMMSSHHQSTMISTMVHKQWGNLLLGASFARGMTYILLYLRPPKSVLPSRPPTEILASFGLIAGGIIFMASSSDTIDGMIHYDLDAMFMYTITMGLVGLLMAWEVVVLAIKGWAVRRELRLQARSGFW